MENPNSLRALTSVSSLARAVNGRPPDQPIIVDDVSMDRPRSPLLEDAQRQSKKGCNSEVSDQSHESAMGDIDQRQKPPFYDMLIGGNADKTEVNYALSAVKEQQRNGSRFAALIDVDVGEFSSNQTAPMGTLLKQAHGGVASGVLDGSHGGSLAQAESRKHISDIVATKGNETIQKSGVGSYKPNVSKSSVEAGQVSKSKLGAAAACVVVLIPVVMAGWHLSRNRMLLFSGVLFITLAVCVHLTPYFPSVSDFVTSVSSVVVFDHRSSCINLVNDISWEVKPRPSVSLHRFNATRNVSLYDKRWDWSKSPKLNACDFQKLSKSDATELLNGSWVVVAGDSQASPC
ncbi:hypothetical protein V6N12_025450 [Hibiscus sabdariffa]|uniref:Uncharacterized protein n=1 Tax=Hibiscus sabdariffa TaxID=183260 RepID=A0ABR2CIH5_9ROSI